MPTPPTHLARPDHDAGHPYAEPGRAFGIPDLLNALRSGKAGFGVRLIITVAVVAFAIACITGLLGLIDAGPGVREWHLALVIPGFGVLALAVVYLIWSSYGRWRRLLKTAFVCLCLIVLTIGACIAVALLGRRMEPVVVAVAFAGAASVIFVIGAGVHLGTRGRPLRTAEGAIRVECPGCGYSMSGLESTSCPECGHRCTIDELIRAQDYEGTRALPPGAATPASPALPAPALAAAPMPALPPPLPAQPLAT